MKPEIIKLGDDQHHGEVFAVVLQGQIVAITYGDQTTHEYCFERDGQLIIYRVGQTLKALTKRCQRGAK